MLRYIFKEIEEFMTSNPISDFWHIVQELSDKIKFLTKQNISLQKEVNELRSKLQQHEHAKTSLNSSLPPSKDSLATQGQKAAKLRITRSLRTKSDKPNGGQPGRKGTTLEISQTPDEVIVYTPDFCNNCGGSLVSAPEEKSETRQVIDIPLPIKPIVTNHVSVSKRCACGHCTSSKFPTHVTTGVSYGVNIQALVTYLNVCQHIAFKRLRETLANFYGLSISDGTISNILNRMRKKAEPAYEVIHQMIENSAVVGADETGCKVNGELQWMWTFQNKLATFVYRNASRGKVAILEHFANGLPRTILTTDRHASYFNVETAGHQICLAHLLRNLTYLDELDTNQSWAARMLQLLRDSIPERKSTAFEKIDILHFKDRFQILMRENLENLDSKYASLQRSLVKHQEHVFVFLENPNVPPDNNASERTIRPLKIKQKVSGMFRSNEGGDNFSTLHSIASTAVKNKQNPFEAFIAIAKFG